MRTFRKSESRGHTRIGWLNSYHTFSFGDFVDSQLMGFGDIRVINDDTVKPGGGFQTHGHQDMEIISLVLSGQLAHKDSLGNGSVIQPGEIQRMSAGTGVMHSEFNPSEIESVHFLQIWILPEQKNLEPSYEQKNFSLTSQNGQPTLIASRHGQAGSVTVHQDMELYMSFLKPQESFQYAIAENRSVWLHIAKGAIQLNGQLLEAGDGVGITAEEDITIEGIDVESWVLLFNIRKIDS